MKSPPPSSSTTLPTVIERLPPHEATSTSSIIPTTIKHIDDLTTSPHSQLTIDDRNNTRHDKL